MRRLTGVNGAADEARLGRTFSPLGSGVVARLLWAGGLAALLWAAAAWAMGWLP
ncbi:MAG: hypothetical protein ACFCUT_00880 [Kiloniellaceae bacterium]